MIYIFTAFKEICGLPGRLCTACSSLWSQCRCTCCQDACDAASQGCRNFLDKPLCSYVLLTTALTVVEIGFCASSFSAPELKGCMNKMDMPKVGIRTWLVLQLGFAAINLVFAPYFQGRVWQNLVERVHTIWSLEQPSQGKVPPKVVQTAFKHVFLHDLGVLFYFFALLASFAWSLKGSDNWSKWQLCNPEGYTAWASWLGMCLFWVAFLYSVSWYWCACCARSVDPSALGLAPKPVQPGHPLPAPPAGTIAGAPSPAQALYQGAPFQSGGRGEIAVPKAPAPGPSYGYMPVRDARGPPSQNRR